MNEAVDHKHISKAALGLLTEIKDVPQVVGFDHRIAELDAKRLITWEPGFGYVASVTGRAHLDSLTPALGIVTA